MPFLRMSSAAFSYIDKFLSQRRMRPDSNDLEFMPDILTLIETPPSPIALKMMIFISIVTISTISWSCFGWIDIQATAHGKIQPIGRTKFVQPVEGGVVKAVLVRNGSSVQLGDLIVELDSIQLLAEKNRVQFALASAEAECVRRQAAINVLKDHGSKIVYEPLSWPKEINNIDIKKYEEAVFISDIDQLIAKHKVLDQEIALKLSSVSRLRAQIEAQEHVLEPLRERMDMRQILFNRGTGSRLDFINAQHDYARQNVELATNRGQLSEIEKDIDLLKQKVIEVSALFKSENAANLLLSSRKVGELTEVLIKQNYRLNNSQIRAPATGVVQELVLTTPGQVVSAGQQLMSIVPTDVSLEIEAAVINSDIGFVRPGQITVLKFDAFPFTRYGSLSGRVNQVSRDAVTSNEAGIRPTPGLGGSSASSNGSKPVGNLQGLVFPITIVPDQSFIIVDGSQIPLLAGMEVTAEIQTGKRRVIDYLLSPLLEIGSTALRER